MQVWGNHLGLWRGVPCKTRRHDRGNCVRIHLIHSSVAREPVESLQEDVEGALVGGRQLGQNQVSQSWLLTAMLYQLRKQPAKGHDKPRKREACMMHRGGWQAERLDAGWPSQTVASRLQVLQTGQSLKPV